jgi:hypothetical protein
MILIFRKYSINSKIIKNNIFNAFIILIIGILAGWSSENGSAEMLVILTLYLMYYYFNNIKFSKYIISGYIGSLIGYALLIGAPGNFVRKTVEQSAVNTSIILIITIGILYDKFDFEAVNIEKNTILMLRRLVLSVTIFASCNFIVMYLDTSMSTYEIRVQTKQREQYILSEKAKGNLDISVPIISHKYPLLSEHDELHGLSDITTDNNNNVNKAVSQYYGINSITGIPTKEKQYLSK